MGRIAPGFDHLSPPPDADVEGSDWREVSKIVLHIDPKHEPDRARRAFDSHLARAKWMTVTGYRHLLGADR